MSVWNLDAATVRARLGLSDDLIPWLEELEVSGQPPTPVLLPDKREVGEQFSRLGVSPEDAADIIAAWPTPEQNPEVWWLLERCHRQLVAHIGELPAPYPPLHHQYPALPLPLGAIGKLFYVYVFLATLPMIRQWHREHGIDDGVSWTTLADLGEHIAIHRRIFGTAGLDVPEWMALHFRGVIYRLGRLQFEQRLLSPQLRDVVGSDGPDLAAPVLSLHIPESGGSLTPAACDESFERARDFFPRHFPQEQYRIAWCTSWLLDPQLGEYLSPTSNIMRFQQRFHLIPGGSDADEGVIRFVFRRATASLAELPQRTSLERTVVKHLQAGRHWQWRSGWFAL